ncbi:MAG: enoyl-CoA hydratase/isomerase family protein [Hyphomicrobiales bacterium]|nr:enoyl-CoA hydratase/isomerase family protein [Hyphomicrobiales bacterium]
MSSAFTTLRTAVTQGVMTVTLDNPPINLMDRAMFSDLRALLDSLLQNHDICAVVFRSAVPDFFICHADLALFKERPAPPRSDNLNFIHSLFEQYRRLPKATIAVIEGRCNGAGTEFATSLDMQFAAIGRAFIGQFEVALGALPGGTGTHRLPALMGRSRALELILGCDELDAATAERYGLVNRALPADAIGPFVDTLARRIATFPLDAIALAKQSVDHGLGDPASALSEESYLAGRLMATSEVRRRFAAILECGGQTPHGERDIASLLTRLGAPA